jgi:thiol-disulfide isomerase/thioredoxin
MNIKLIVIILLGVGAYLFFSSPNYEQGDLVPDFSLETIEGESVSLGDYAGKVIFLEFFNTWCPYCKQAYPSTKKLSAIYPWGEQVVFLKINRGEEPTKVQEFVNQYPSDWKVLVDKDEKIYRSFFDRGVPAFVIINSSGELSYKTTGWGSSVYNDLLSELKKLVPTSN